MNKTDIALKLVRSFRPNPQDFEWLESLTTKSIHEGPIPISRVISGSTYYPACRFDGEPVRYLGLLTPKFVYVDYGISQSQLAEALTRVPFKGYDLIARRAVDENEIMASDWRGDQSIDSFSAPLSQDGVRKINSFFCFWHVLERQPHMDPAHGPRRISILYLAADGVHAFKRIYSLRGLSPRALVLVQPGHGFGGNWTNFMDEDGPLARTVLNNLAGIPAVLLCGGRGRRKNWRPCPWSRYERLMGWYPYSDKGSVGIWY